MAADPVVIITARNEADRLPATLVALRGAFPHARILVADDGSDDGTAQVARDGGAEAVRAPRPLGKGGAATLAAERLLPLAADPDPPVILLCDGDLGDSAAALVPLVETVRRGEADLAVASFARRVGGGFGVALGFARWAIRRRCGLQCDAPISGQRALRAELLPAIVPFAPRFGMEIGMTIDAARAGARIVEVQLDLAHRATSRSWRGFVHRGRQLLDFLAVYLTRRSSGPAAARRVSR